MTRPVEWSLRLALVALALCLCLGRPADTLLIALAPTQQAVFSMVMPDFSVRRFTVEQRGAHLKLRAVSANHRYLVVRDRAYAPGFEFDVETPVRAGPMYGAATFGGIALTVRRSRRWFLPIGIGSLLAGALTVLVAPVILAGQQWGLVLHAFEDLSPPAVLVGASNFLLHGGAYALCAAAVWAVALRPRRR